MAEFLLCKEYKSEKNHVGLKLLNILNAALFKGHRPKMTVVLKRDITRRHKCCINSICLQHLVQFSGNKMLLIFKREFVQAKPFLSWDEMHYSLLFYGLAELNVCVKIS